MLTANHTYSYTIYEEEAGPQHKAYWRTAGLVCMLGFGGPNRTARTCSAAFWQLWPGGMILLVDDKHTIVGGDLHYPCLLPVYL
jgi:hypothetical protein